jgi:predicted dehydrogenase
MTGTSGRASLGVGVVGYGFMGAAHADAWRTAAHVFDLPLQPAMVAVCGRDAAAARAAADRQGWASVETDWRELIARDDIDLVDICTPGDSHAAIAIAALDAGKHVLCEKPLANTLAEGEAMNNSARRAGRRGARSMVGFNYRRVPAIALAHKLVCDGRLGPIRHVRASYLQDWLTDPSFPMTWRLEALHAGSGALGDLGAHIIDLAQYLTGEPITAVSGSTTTFITERPVPGSDAREPRGKVTVDDAAVFTARIGAGTTLGSFEATRFAAGHKNGLRIELNGARGSLAFDLERLNELEFCDLTADPATAGFRRILVTEPGHPYLSAWWPPGHVLGWDVTFSHEVADLVTAIAAGTDPEPSFADGLQVQRVLAAVQHSAATGGTWVPVPPPGA